MGLEAEGAHAEVQDGAPATETPGGGGTPAGGGASAEWKTLLASPAYMDGSHADHKQTVTRANALARQIFGEGTPSAGAEGDKPLYSNVPRPTLPDGVPWPTATENVLRKEGHAAGLTDRQVSHFLGVIENAVRGSHERRESEKMAGMQALRTRWGAKGDENLALAHAAVSHFGPQLAEKLERTGLGNDPLIAEIFFQLGSALKNQGVILSDVDGITGRENIRAELDRLRRSAPYFDGSHANHKAVVAAVNKLSKRLYGKEA